MKQAATKFTPREYAIYNQVWSLGVKERQQLDSCFILRSTTERLKLRVWRLNTTGNLYLPYKNIHYNLQIGELGHYSGNILISLRHSDANSYSVALLKILTEPLSQHALSTFSELE